MNPTTTVSACCGAEIEVHKYEPPELELLEKIGKKDTEWYVCKKCKHSCTPAHPPTETVSDRMPTIAEALEFRMEQYQHTVSDTARIIGVQTSRISEILHGKRKPSLSITKKLYRYGIPATVLLQKENQ